jgi:protein-disulfide isomerase
VTSPVALGIVVLFAVGVGAVIGFFPRETSASQEASYPPLTNQQKIDLEKWWAVQPKVDLPIPNDGAKVLIVKFSDYMCPGCRQTYEGFKGILGKYLAGGQVRYVVKHFPLEGECNANTPNGGHFASCEAAAAVIMARSKGTAEKLEQWIFTNQTTLTPATVKQAAKDIGGIQDFDAQYQHALQEVKTDASLGGLLGVNSTPTFYINGRKLGIVPPQYFDYLIELALKQPK